LTGVVVVLLSLPAVI